MAFDLQHANRTAGCIPTNHNTMRHSLAMVFIVPTPAASKNVARVAPEADELLPQVPLPHEPCWHTNTGHRSKAFRDEKEATTGARVARAHKGVASVVKAAKSRVSFWCELGFREKQRTLPQPEDVTGPAVSPQLLLGALLASIDRTVRIRLGACNLVD